MMSLVKFLYSQDLSNSKTTQCSSHWHGVFLYSQDLSNSKTFKAFYNGLSRFLYSQDLSNSKTEAMNSYQKEGFCTLKI